MTDRSPVITLERESATKEHLDNRELYEYIALDGVERFWPDQLSDQHKEVKPRRGHTQPTSAIQAAYMYGTLEHMASHAVRHVRTAFESKLTTFASQLETHASRLHELSQLEENWDSYGAVPPTAQAVATANLLIQKLASASVRRRHTFKGPWAIVPVPDGGIQFHWRDARREIELEIFPNGGLYCFVELDGQTIAESDEASSIDANDALAMVIRGLG